MSADSPSSAYLRRAVVASGVLAASMGLFMLAAWFSGAAARWSAAGATITMKTNMALGLVLAGAVLILLGLRPQSRGCRRAGLGAAALILLIGGLTLSEHFIGWDLGIDQLLAKEAPGAAATASPNRMGLPGSISHALLGIAFLLLGTGRRRIGPYLGLAIILINLVPAVGFLYGIDEFFRSQTGIAWPTVLAMIGLGLGLVLSCPEGGPMPLLMRDDAGGKLLRGLLPLVLLLPLGLGFLRMLGQVRGFYDTAMGAGLFALAMMLIFSLMLWRSAAQMSRADDVRKRGEEALRAGDQRLRLTLQAGAMGTFEVDLVTGEGQWNDVEFQLLGLQPGDAPAHPETFFRFVHRDDVEPLRAQWQEATRTGEFNAEFRIVRADGQERWLAGKGQFSSAEQAGDKPGASGRALRFQGVNYDITERKRAENAVAAAQRQVQSIVDNTTSIVYALDLEERFLIANAAVAEVLNSTPEQMIGKRRHEFMPKDDADWHEANDRKVIEAGTALEFEEYSQLKGRSITWLTTKFPLRDAQGRIYAVAGISTDVSERKRAEAELKAAKAAAESASRAKDQFIAVLSHELRTPLTPAVAALSLLRSDMRLPSDVREDLEMVSRNIDLEVRLIADLLDVSRTLSGKMHLDQRPIDVANAIREAAKIVSGDLDAKGQTLTIDTPGTPYLAFADAARLQQVFWNLLRNAVKFSPEKSRITVRAQLVAVEHCPLAAKVCPVGMGDCPLHQAINGDGQICGGNLVVEVIDHGNGIAPDMLPRLFTPFVQERLEATVGGLGLGLSICKAVVELHGGTISAHSDGVGCGATFTIRLPVAQCPLSSVTAQPVDDGEPEADNPAPGANHPLRVLLVEDHADTAKLMRRLLMADGHEVTTAGCVAEGLAAVQRATPDVLISDLGLPDGSGLDLIRQLVAQGHRIPAIALSGYGTPADIEKSKAAGFAEHLVKPLNSVELLTAAVARLGVYGRGKKTIATEVP